MTGRSQALRTGGLAAAVGLAVAAAAAAAYYSLFTAETFMLGLGLVLAAALALGMALLPPSLTLTGGLVFSAFSGSWAQLGLPGGFPLDRLLIAGALIALWDRRKQEAVVGRLRVRPTHLLMAAATAYAIGSAIAAGALDTQATRLVDRLGVTGFVVFLVAPMAFARREDRTVLLWGLVGLGGYLGVTAMLETIGPKSLVFPRYIGDPGYGIHVGRARGPFVEAEVNGFAMYVSAVAAAILFQQSRSGVGRLVTTGVIGLCALGMLFTLSRSVWLSSVVATVVAMASDARLRRYLIPAALGTAALVAAALLTVPGLSGRAEERRANQRTVWDRQNLTVAAVNMVEERPLLGFGFASFGERGTDYFWQGDIPLTAGTGTVVHNAVLANLAELGLIGTTLWLLALVTGVGGVLVARGPPEFRPWRIGLLAIAISWLIMAAFTPVLQPFQSLSLWLFAGAAGAAAAAGPRREVAP